jgi:SAM-dependent methyltransferase
MVATKHKIDEFRSSVRTDWAGDDTAAAWQKHYSVMTEQLALVTNAMVEAAAPQPGMSVLDLASGTGQPALSIAPRVGVSGTVVATDQSEGMLRALRANAHDQGQTNVETRVCDAHDLPFPDARFDLVTSRFGAMFFADVRQALAEMRRVLKHGGRTILTVWGPSVPDSMLGTLATPIIRRLAVKPDPDGPSPMRFAESGKLTRLVEDAGFLEVTENSLTLPAPFPGSPEEYVTHVTEIATPLRNAAATLLPHDRRAAEEETYNLLRPLYDGRKTNLKAPVIIVTGMAP